MVADRGGPDIRSRRSRETRSRQPDLGRFARNLTGQAWHGVAGQRCAQRFHDRPRARLVHLEVRRAGHPIEQVQVVRHDAHLDESLGERRLRGDLPAQFKDAVLAYKKEIADKPASVATRKASEAVIGALAPSVPELITGSVCGVKVQEVQDPLMRQIRYLDKLVDELAKGRPMEKILRTPA